MPTTAAGAGARDQLDPMRREGARDCPRLSAHYPVKAPAVGDAHQCLRSAYLQSAPVRKANGSEPVSEEARAGARRLYRSTKQTGPRRSKFQRILAA